MATFDEIRQQISKPMKGYVEKMLQENQQFLNKGKKFINPTKSSTTNISPYKVPKRKVPKKAGPIVSDYLNTFGKSSPWIEDIPEKSSPWIKDRPPELFEQKYVQSDKAKKYWADRDKEYRAETEHGYGYDYGIGTDLPYTEEVVDYTGKKIVLAASSDKELQQKKIKFLSEDRKSKNKYIKDEEETLKEKTFAANVEAHMKLNKWSKNRAIEVSGYLDKSYHELLQLQNKYIKYFKKDDEGNFKYGEETRNVFEQKLDDLQSSLDSKRKEEDEDYLTSDIKYDETPDTEVVEDYSVGLKPGGVSVRRMPYLEEDPINYVSTGGIGYTIYKGAWYSKNSWEKKKRELQTNYENMSDRHEVLFEQNITRNFERDNEDGSVSTVLMENGSWDGEYFAYPTLFPVDPDDPNTEWIELEGEEAAKEAQRRDELIQFDTDWEAQQFALGSWKGKGRWKD